MKNAMSARSITIAIQGVAIIGLAAAVIFTARSAEMAAAAAAQLVQNVDEPARNLYQQTVSVSYSAMLFSPVPTGKTLRITHASCWIGLNDSNGVQLVSVHSGTYNDKIEYVSSAAQGDATIVVANSEINLYVPAGTKPFIYISENTSDFNDGDCTLSGYYVAN